VIEPVGRWQLSFWLHSPEGSDAMRAMAKEEMEYLQNLGDLTAFILITPEIVSARRLDGLMKLGSRVDALKKKYSRTYNSLFWIYMISVVWYVISGRLWFFSAAKSHDWEPPTLLGTTFDISLPFGVILFLLFWVDIKDLHNLKGRLFSIGASYFVVSRCIGIFMPCCGL
jgi:hypothetical protein